MKDEKPLCIKDALELYRILKPHLPETFDKDEIAATFVKKIIDNMAADDPDAYLQSVVLMSGKSEEELRESYDGQKVLGLFIDGLIKNHVVLLVDFSRAIGL